MKLNMLQWVHPDGTSRESCALIVENEEESRALLRIFGKDAKLEIGKMMDATYGAPRLCEMRISSGNGLQYLIIQGDEQPAKLAPAPHLHLAKTPLQ